ncbi:MAG: signal peptidase I [Chloroflexi bacterium]|jgi:signal peptidase|nr:signal peptidase I [Chloroflexota bacterium]
MDRTYRLARRSADAALVALVATIGLVAGIGLLAPALGLTPLVIRGASMEPAIPRGSMILVTAGPDRAIAAGDVISFREANATIVTHRVVAIAGTGDAALLTTKGDANTDRDPAALPAGRVIGRVAVALPVLGFISAMLSLPSGIAAFVLLALGLVALSWLITELAPGPCAACAAEREGHATAEPDEAGALA